MEGEGDTAIRAIARFAAVAAKQRSGKAAPIQKQNCLLAFLETISDSAAQFFRQNRNRPFFPAFLAKIDNAHERHLPIVHALRQGRQPILADGRVVITLQ